MEQARAAVAALEVIDVPAAMLSVRGKLLAANSLFGDRLGAEVFDLRAGVRLGDARADALLNRENPSLSRG